MLAGRMRELKKKKESHHVAAIPVVTDGSKNHQWMVKVAAKV